MLIEDGTLVVKDDFLYARQVAVDGGIVFYDRCKYDMYDMN